MSIPMEISSLPTESTSVRTAKRKLNNNAKIILRAAEASRNVLDSPDLVSRFRVMFEDAKDAWARFVEYWESIEEIFIKAKEDDKFPGPGDLRFYENIEKGMLDARVAFASLEKLEPQPPLDASMLNNTSFQRPSNLPRIKIPQFDGDLLKWSHFRDNFVSLVHEESTISNVEKFNYLREALKGEAASLISKMSVTSDSYELAWSAIMKHYDNPRVLASHYVHNAIDFTPKNSRPSLEVYKEFLTCVADNIEAFKSMRLKDSTEFLLSLIALRGLDPTTRREFELAHLQTKFPTTAHVFEYVRNRITALRLCSDDHPNSTSPIGSRRPVSRSAPRPSSPRYQHVTFRTGQRTSSTSPSKRHPAGGAKRSPSPVSRSQQTISGSSSCPFCKGKHELHRCFEFNDSTRKERIEFMHRLKGCLNCLKSGHRAQACPSKFSCKFCGKRHHSLLHENAETEKPPGFTSGVTSKEGHSSSYHTHEGPPPTSWCRVILGTARISVRTRDGKPIACRALLDSASHFSFVTARLARRLGGRIRASNVTVSGLGGASLSRPSGMMSCFIVGRGKEFATDALIVERISHCMPATPVRPDIIEELSQVDLADTSFGRPGRIDVLIGGDLFPVLLTGAPCATNYPGIHLLPTEFGLVALGKTPEEIICALPIQDANTPSGLDRLVERFWKVEEPQITHFESPEDVLCEQRFVRDHVRNEDGRFVVKLPLHPDAKPLGDNRAVAIKRFMSLERRLQSDHELSEQYRKFMKDYVELGHMTPAQSTSNYIIPHHGIWQSSARKKKLRVVFDASSSAKSPDGQFRSLNDSLLKGPKLQSDIADVFTRFRMHQIVVTVDIVKMYRQFLLHPEQRRLQHIFWREQPSEKLREYELNTLTYGVKPSAYLAMRCVRQLVLDEGHAFPLAAPRILSDTYVDDFISGTDTVEEAFHLRQELIHIFAKGGLELDKWASNAPDLIPRHEQRETPLSLSEPDDHSVKILGMVWEPSRDIFSYAITQPRGNGSKRMLLSMIARMFDPLGLLAPVIFRAKALMQELWKASIGWDEPIPDELVDRWKALTHQWAILSNVSIPRLVTSPQSRRSLVGFCDASQRGSAAAVYLRSESQSGKVEIHLLKAKTKIAPMHYISIARLELCSAVLLTRLLSSLRIPGCCEDHTRCFTDSTVVLSWLRIPTNQLKTYEANRVQTILEGSSVDMWSHVRSEENPADLASRGCSSSDLLQSQLWWSGPSWLKGAYDDWPVWRADSSEKVSPEVTTAINFSVQAKSSMDLSDWMSRFSSLHILVRTVVRILRFLRRKFPRSGPISSEEFEEGLTKCVHLVQHSLLGSVFQGSEVPAVYRDLSLFIDDDGLIKVGGRLRHASIPRLQKHPIFLPRSHLSRLIVNDVHSRNFHAGPTLTLALTRCKYWIPGGLRYVKGRVSQCILCRKRKPKILQPPMAALPKERFSQFRAFIHTGVDFAGPFMVKESNRRKSPRNINREDKAYLCIFICLASKAVHLECVSALTTTAFLAALDRFCCRRGPPKRILSDNGTNFVGASRFLKDLYGFLHGQEDIITEFLSPKGIEWQFNPPHSPHFGGVWEAGVKSVKNLLVSVVGPQGFTFEELATVFTRIEGLLNSRPICPLNEDADQLDFLTPGHFLMGCSPYSIPDASEQTHVLDRWDVVRRQVNHVWDRWRKEYLHHLQQKGKWLRDQPNLRIGDVVLLAKERPPTGVWPLARIVAVHPGEDARVRVVSVRLASGSVFKRPVSSLAPLFPPEGGLNPDP